MWVTKCKVGTEIKLDGPAVVKVLACGDGKLPVGVVKIGVEAAASTKIVLEEPDSKKE